MREIKGQLHRISQDFRLFSIQVVDKLEFFYLQPRFVKQFRKYLYPGVFIQFTTEDEKRKYRRRLVSNVLTIEQIIGHRYNRKFSYFDQKIVEQKIIEKINQHPYRLFLDLELTMQHSKTHSEEIVQAGAILVDNNDQVLYEFDAYIQPTKITHISKRTLEFLRVRATTIKQGVPYQTFYDEMKQIVDQYQPAVIVWGNNDNYALDQSYIINEVPPLFKKDHYINLQQVLKQYYNINYEIGLFQAAEIYGIDVGVQKHDAFTDSLVTRAIFNRFYDHASSHVDFNFKERLLNQL